MEKLFAFIMSIITMITSLLTSFFPSAQKNYEVFKDVEYGDEVREVMDIYIPDSSYENTDNGCILFIHGGSWTSGDKKDMASRCQEMANKGYVTATMSYTLFSEEIADWFTVDIMLDEIGMALQKVKDFAFEKGVTVTKACTSGFSSGAHISMLYSYSRKSESPLELTFTANQVGPSDFSVDVWGELGLTIAGLLSGTPITDEMISNGEAEKVIASVSPAAYINQNSIPSLFGYGGKDTIVPAGNGEAVKNAFEKSGVKFDFILYPNSNHLLLSDPDSSVLYQQTFDEYCKTYFGY